MPPTVGRMVHFYNSSWVFENGQGPYAAIVTSIVGSDKAPNVNELVNLTVFTKNGEKHQEAIPREGLQPGFSSWWTWPPREGEAKTSKEAATAGAVS